MPAKKEETPSVSYQQNPDGSHSIGVVHDGVFLAYASLEDAIVKDRVAAAQSPEWKEAHPDAPGGEEG